jgi:predicted MFS family arabinose efflux permease
MTRTASLTTSVPDAGAAAAPSGLPGWRVLLLASAAGLAVASTYYSQPILAVLAAEMGASAHAIGLVPTLTQLGYALGIVFLAPLGDRYDRRSIILGKTAALLAALLLAAQAPRLGVLLFASFAIGMAATVAQDIVPAAATLAAPAHRGRAVGKVMTGLLLGILLSRVASGLVAQVFGWRMVFLAAGAGIALLGVALWHGLPRFEPTTHLRYRALLASLFTLVRRHGALRRAALAQGLLSVGFSAFWSTLAVMLHGEPFRLGSAVAGAFGLAGAAGALIAPLAGRLADRKGPLLVARLGTALAIASFAGMALAPWLNAHAQLWLLAACTIGFDLGMQAALIAHQTIVYGIEPGARSRLNAVLMAAMFIGMAAGSAAGSLTLAQFGWPAVVTLAVATAIAAWVIEVWPPMRLPALPTCNPGDHT